MRKCKRQQWMIVFFIITAGSICGTLGASEQSAVERFALYIGSSTGGGSRDVLKYAGSDATKIASAMNEIGGIKKENSILLIDPDKRDMEKAFDTVKKKVAKKKDSARRTEFVFYYSGHSDEANLLLGNEEYPYAKLKKSLTEVHADVEVVMLDSCYSGNFVRTKGGSREKAFLFDDSTIVKGHAYLSSSSEFEASQEADSIQSSYFTYALVTGMRGAADTTADGKVSLNELYHYAFNDTLYRTEFSRAGPQHPSYNITLVGSGDLVLTDVSQAESVLLLENSTEGRYFVRNSSGLLVAEVNKLAGTAIALALPAGNYLVSVVTADSTAQKNLTIKKGERVSIDGSGFVSVTKTDSVSRGTSDETIEPLSENKSDTPQDKPAILNIGFWPGFGLNLVSKSPDAYMALNMFGSMQRTIYGIQISGFSNVTTGTMNGVQVSTMYNNAKNGINGVQMSGFVNMASAQNLGVQSAGLVNISSGTFSGVQSAGLVNISGSIFSGVQAAGLVNVAKNVNGVQAAGLVSIAKNVNGVQAAGLVNVAKNVNGVQAGIINIANDVKGIQLGLLNFILNGIMSPAVYVDSNQTIFAQYQGGTNYFYTVYYIGTPWDFSGEYIVTGAGIGARLPLGSFFSIDFDVTAKRYEVFDNGTGVAEIVTSRKELKKYRVDVMPSFRVSFNISPFKHFSIFGGAILDVDFTDSVPRNAASPMKFGNSTAMAHPSFFAGLKF